MPKPAGDPVLARRFMHVNLNVVDAARTADFYQRLAGLTVGMRTLPEPGDGSILGFEQELVTAETYFLYDHRGGRVVGSLEAVAWSDPATHGDVYPSPSQPGLQAVTFEVPDPRAAAEEAGAAVVGEAPEGLLRPGQAAVCVRDPDGVLVELVTGEPGRPGESRGARLTASDLDATVAWYTGIGFLVDVPVETVTVAGGVFGLDAAEVTVRAARLVLPDEPSHALTVVGWPDSATQREPTYSGANHRGLYRMALHVENAQAAVDALRSNGIDGTAPRWCPLPGTKLGGVHIAFLADPDGVVVELVERPGSSFRDPAS